MKPVEEVSDEAWRAIFAVNLDGAFHFTRAAAPAMKSRGRGIIVNISSGAGRSYSLSGFQAYASAMAGLIGFTAKPGSFCLFCEKSWSLLPTVTSVDPPGVIGAA